MAGENVAYWMQAAEQRAREATCERARCGAVVVRKGELQGAGSNGPARGALRYCGQASPSLVKPKSDRTCCVHAEWRAILQAVATDGAEGSTLFFARVGEDDAPLYSGLPYCTVCSRLALEVGIKDWVLSHPIGLRRYPAVLYDELSHRFDDLSAEGTDGDALYRRALAAGEAIEP